MSDPIRTAPRALWLIAQTFLNTLFALFGPPEAVAFQHTHTGAQRALMLPWLRAGEALMRRLLLIEAAAFPKPNTRPLLTPTRAKRVRKLVGFDDDKPETWRVRFRCFEALPGRSEAKGRGPFVLVTERPQSRSKMDPGSSRFALRPGSVDSWQGECFTAKPTTFHSAWPLAERYEALIRVFNDPAPFAARLARRLHATPHRARELMRLPTRRRARRSGDPADPPDLIGPDFAALEAVCGSSWAALNSS